MRKFEIEHLEGRITEIVRCTNGTISTKLNSRKKGVGLTTARQLEMIRNGRAVLKDDLYLANTNVYSGKLLERAIQSFDFPLTSGQQDKIDWNKRIDSKIEELHTEVSLQGKRVLDSAILGITKLADIPDELIKLSQLSDLAVCEV